MDVPPRLVEHLRTWLGAWPPQQRVDVVGWPARDAPGWDGRIHPVIGVSDPSGTVLSVPPAHAEAAAGVAGAPGDEGYGEALAVAVGRPGHVFARGVMRWTTSVVDLPDAGVWLPHDDPRVPAWLHPFGGDVLVALDGDVVVAGVGIKRHDPAGRELAVVTEAPARGRGLARRLVAQAARRVLAEGAVPTYLHDPANVASARVADAVGFPDRGWSVWGIWPPRHHPDA